MIKEAVFHNRGESNSFQVGQQKRSVVVLCREGLAVKNKLEHEISI